MRAGKISRRFTFHPACLRELLVLTVLVAVPVPILAQPTANRVDAIRARGYLVCGVWPEVRGFATVDAAGAYVGFDVDICRAVAAAILGSPDRTVFVRTKTVQAFVAAPDVDMVSRRLTWSLTREGLVGVRFGPVTFYDGQAFLVPASLGVTRLAQLAGRRTCVDAGSPSEFNLGPLFRARGLALEQVLLAPEEDVEAAFASGRCQAYTADVTLLGSIRAGFRRPAAFTILPDIVSKEPLAQVVRQHDEALLAVLRWTVFALINAEELGITSRNVEALLHSDNADVQRLLGSEPGNGAALGLSEHWAVDVIRAMGNYGELYERTVGSRSAIGLPRGMNELWTRGGLMWAPPAR